MPSSLLFLLLSSVFFNCIGSPVFAGRRARDSSDVINKKEVDALKKELLSEINDVEAEVTDSPGTEESQVDNVYRKFLRLDDTKKTSKKQVQNGVPTAEPTNPTTIANDIILDAPKEAQSDDVAVDDKAEKGIALDENDNSQDTNKDVENDVAFVPVLTKDSDIVNREQTEDEPREVTASQPQALRVKKDSIKGKDFDNKGSEMDDVYFIIIVAGCSVAGIAGLMLAGYCWYKLHNTQKQVNESEYKGSAASRRKSPTSVNKAPGDEKLDYNAEMYHYQHTKNQISAMEKAKAKTLKGESLEDEDEDDDVGDEGEDDTVYECPGLAPAGDMTVMNPLFSDPEAHASDDTISGQSSPQTPRAKPKH